jgi:hypothetical protein
MTYVGTFRRALEALDNTDRKTADRARAEARLAVDAMAKKLEFQLGNVRNAKAPEDALLFLETIAADLAASVLDASEDLARKNAALRLAK